MNQIVYFKIFIFSLLLLAFPLEAKLLKPSQDGEKKEILIINGKRRLYYPVQAEGTLFCKWPYKVRIYFKIPSIKEKK